MIPFYLPAYYSDICVGAIACWHEKKENEGQVRLLNHVIDLCSKQNISEVYLHVQTNNEDAISFYKKFGFEITETIQNYYTNITPPDCYVLTRYTAPRPTKK
ncbi:putative methionine N(alpha)-acetyltransferase NatB transcription regulator GNAT family [Lupinus albus]|uniref:Putative methionine N(Alpha)-acetyltransferase NatB transcription regulator GNAT family n=1 Tax=Lupinus albus TaxID=3870 RepID=A0A6A4QMH5_LUPAL|nr:putative methionine N(alpha)-acetyltransferase NatB transcription regulator GNAT family [Lupinus albus]